MLVSKLFKKAPESMVCMQTPRDYQTADLKKLLQWKRSADFSEVGTGKSLKSYLYIVYKVLEGKKVVVIMPPPLIPQYVYEFQRIFPNTGFDFQEYAMPLAKRKKVLERIEEEGLPDVSFMSYQLWVKYHKIFITLGMGALVCDEAHAIKNTSTKNFLSVFKYLDQVDGDFLEMTATPATAELRDAYAHIRLRTPSAYSSLRQFDSVHTNYKMIGDYEKIVGYRNQEKIQENLNQKAVRRRAVDVLPLEKPIVVEQRILLSNAHMKLYKKLLKERILEMGDKLLIGENPQKLRQMALQLVTNVENYSEAKVVDEPLAMLDTIITSLGGNKLMVFCQYRATVEKLNKHFSKLNPALMYGGSNVPKNVDKFNNDPTCLIGIANYRSGGAGLNLQEHCHNEVFFESTGVPAELTQAIGRVQRSGQKKVVNVWLFRYQGTLGVRLIDSALGRASSIKDLMRDKESVLDSLLLSD